MNLYKIKSIGFDKSGWCEIGDIVTHLPTTFLGNNSGIFNMKVVDTGRAGFVLSSEVVKATFVDLWAYKRKSRLP